VFGFTTPIPYPFGDERTGSLVTDIDAAVQAARADGADVIVAPFADALGRDAVIQWPGGVNMQLYWHTAPPSYPPLAAVPENRIYLSKDRADAFIRDFVAFSHGAVVSDEPAAPGVEIGRAGETYRRVRIESNLGKVVALVTDGICVGPTAARSLATKSRAWRKRWRRRARPGSRCWSRPPLPTAA
jgi:hypothetical protein